MYNSTLFIISALKIHISSETAMALQGVEGFNVERRGELEIKVRERNTQRVEKCSYFAGQGCPDYLLVDWRAINIEMWKKEKMWLTYQNLIQLIDF